MKLSGTKNHMALGHLVCILTFGFKGTPSKTRYLLEVPRATQVVATKSPDDTSGLSFWNKTEAKFMFQAADSCPPIQLPKSPSLY